MIRKLQETASNMGTDYTHCHRIQTLDHSAECKLNNPLGHSQDYSNLKNGQDELRSNLIIPFKVEVYELKKRYEKAILWF